MKTRGISGGLELNIKLLIFGDRFRASLSTVIKQPYRNHESVMAELIFGVCLVLFLCTIYISLSSCYLCFYGPSPQLVAKGRPATTDTLQLHLYVLLGAVLSIVDALHLALNLLHLFNIGSQRRLGVLGVPAEPLSFRLPVAATYSIPNGCELSVVVAVNQCQS